MKTAQAEQLQAKGKGTGLSPGAVVKRRAYLVPPTWKGGIEREQEMLSELTETARNNAEALRGL